MKTVLSILFLSFGCWASAQNLKVDSLITSQLGKYSIQVGNPVMVEHSDIEAIAFFEMQFLDSIEKDKKSPISEYMLYPRPALTLFHVLQFDETTQSYQKITVDTLDANSGYSGCHMANTVDSAAIVTHGKSTSLVLLICHPVVPTCNSMTYYFLKSYAISSEAERLVFTSEYADQSFDYGKRNWQKEAFDNISWKKP